MTKKYNYHDYKAPKTNKIPDDLNKLPFVIADKLDKTGDLKKALLHIQDSKLFGPYNYICNTTGRLRARFEFQSGMCKKIDLAKYLKNGKMEDLELVGHSHFMQTILNPDLDFNKKENNSKKR